ncbi:hypothetical protein [Nostoc sp.]|uniref:hypothetical protein n=1 Tax=Nostoc sp. TaxID=1180 RepID=UPI002FF6B1A3
MSDLIVYQLSDKTVLKKLKPETKMSLIVGSVEKLDNSDDRFVIRQIERKSKNIYFDGFDEYRCERTQEHKEIHTTYVTVEIDLEWRNNQLKMIEDNKNTSAGLFYSSLGVLLISFFIHGSNSPNKQHSSNFFIDIISGLSVISTPLLGLNFWGYNRQKHIFTELKNNQDST